MRQGQLVFQPQFFFFEPRQQGRIGEGAPLFGVDAGIEARMAAFQAGEVGRCHRRLLWFDSGQGTN